MTEERSVCRISVDLFTHGSTEESPVCFTAYLLAVFDRYRNALENADNERRNRFFTWLDE